MHQLNTRFFYYNTAISYFNDEYSCRNFAMAMAMAIVYRSGVLFNLFNILTELEEKIVSQLFNDEFIKFYIRYVDDTLVLVKRQDIDHVFAKLNSFHPNLRFTVDPFLDNKVHFLDLSIDRTSTDIYHKDTHTGQYTHFTSFTPWRFKIAWVQSLYHRARKICSNDNLFTEQLLNIRKFMSWNGFPKHISKSLLNKLNKTPDRTSSIADTDIPTIWLTLPYAGLKGETLVKSCVRKIHRYLKQAKIVVRYNNKKLSFFCSTKDNIPIEQRSEVIYEITCPGCGGKYIGKTDRCLIIRMIEQGSKDDQPMYRHLGNCAEFKDYVSLFALPGLNRNCTNVNLESHKLNAVSYK